MGSSSVSPYLCVSIRRMAAASGTSSTSAASSSGPISSGTTSGIPASYEFFGSEKSAVVLDIGSAYTKCGFAGESHPRHLIPSSHFTISSGKKVILFPIREEISARLCI